MQSKVCECCVEDKTLKDFPIYGGNGGKKYRDACTSCYKTYRDRNPETVFKNCAKCDERLPFTTFNKQNKTIDGLQPSCRKCCKTKDKQVKEEINQDSMKECCMCTKVKNVVTEFSYNKTKQIYSGKCKSCIRIQGYKQLKILLINFTIQAFAI